MNIKPIGERILVKIREKETKTATGLFIPDTAQEKTQEAIVVAVGDDKEKIKVKVDDNIIYEKYAGTPIKFDGNDYLILKMDDVIAVVG